MNDIVYDIAFSLDESITPLEKTTLYKNFLCSRKILELGKNTIKNILGRKWTGTRFNPDKFISQAKNLISFIDKSGIKTVKFNHPNYPEGLKQIPDHPFLLYYKGNINYDYDKSIAIVGTRNPDEKGIENTKIFSEYLTEHKFTIISGLAEGIDVESHKESLKNNGKTFAVLGCGIDRIYPASNKDVAKDILNNDGCIISEYPPGFEPRKWYFPRRNRIIVGLSRGVLIVQTPERSGSLISAFLAGDYSRDLYVVSPESKNLDKEKGNHMLIRVGATEVKSPNDIINDWNL